MQQWIDVPKKDGKIENAKTNRKKPHPKKFGHQKKEELRSLGKRDCKFRPKFTQLNPHKRLNGYLQQMKKHYDRMQEETETNVLTD